MSEKKTYLIWFFAGLIYFILGFRNQNTPFVVLGFACIAMAATEKEKNKEDKSKS